MLLDVIFRSVCSSLTLPTQRREEGRGSTLARVGFGHSVGVSMRASAQRSRSVRGRTGMRRGEENGDAWACGRLGLPLPPSPLISFSTGPLLPCRAAPFLSLFAYCRKWQCPGRHNNGRGRGPRTAAQKVSLQHGLGAPCGTCADHAP